MLRARRATGIVFFPAYDWAISPTHPEREERLLYTQDQLQEEGIFDIEGIQELKSGVADVRDVMRTHFCFPDVREVVTDSHLIAAGGAIRAAEAVLDKQVERAFALVRPPGHHAMKVVHGNRGFCNINNEAIMVDRMREKWGVRKVAIVDTDCHHGDGTQDIYWHDPDVLFISFHQDGRTLYPGTGHIHECGGPNARGRTINIPLPPGTSDKGYLYALNEMVMPILDDFKPEIIVNSAGQDNHYTDPITNMGLSARGYAALNDMLNPHVSVLEGGYSIRGALPYVNCGIILAMAGLDYSHVREPDYDENYREQGKEIDTYIHELKDLVLNSYFNPFPEKDLPVEGEWHTREKRIFYDTDQIADDQIESVMVCKECPGALAFESRSSCNPPCAGVEIPLYACKNCCDKGVKMFQSMVGSEKFSVVYLMNKRDREFIRKECLN